MSSYLDKTGLEHFWQKIKSNFSSIELTDQVAANVDNIEKLQDKISNNIINVKDYGAVGDGITNDSEAIQAALAISNNVYLPEGIYLLNNPINIDNDYSNFICHGTLLVNNCAAINLTASYSNIHISHITSSALPESEDSNLWDHDNYCWDFKNRGHGIVFGNGTTKIVAYNTVEVDHMERIQNGFWFTPDADGIGGYGGVMYNTIKFDYLFADRGIYFNCGDTITYDTDGVTMIHGPWVNGNLFYGGRIRGNHPIYTVKGAGQTDPYGGSVFYYLGLEGCYRPMMLQFFQSNRFIEIRATISENGLDRTYDNAQTDGAWDLTKLQAITTFTRNTEDNFEQIYNPFFIVFDEKSWFNDISYTSFFDMKRVLDWPKNDTASIYQYNTNIFRGHLRYIQSDTDSRDLGQVGRIISKIFGGTNYRSVVVIPESPSESILINKIDCNYIRQTTEIDSQTYLYMYNGSRSQAIENEVFRFFASNVDELSTQNIYFTLPSIGYGWGGVKNLYIHISDELENVILNMLVGGMSIPIEKFSGPGLYHLQYFDISEINWLVTKIDTTVSNLKNLIIQGNGNVLDSYDGKEETVINITPENIGAVSTSGDTITGDLSVSGNLYVTGTSNETGYINTKSLAISKALQMNNGVNPKIEFYASTVNSLIGTIGFTTPEGENDKAINNLRVIQYSRSSTDYSKLEGYEGYELPAVETDIPDVPNSKWYKFLTTKNTVKIEQGGTGATDAATARTKLGITPANIGAISTSGGTINGNLSATGLIATDFLDANRVAIAGEFYVNNGNYPTIKFNSSVVSGQVGAIYYGTSADKIDSNLRFLQYSRSSTDYSRLEGYEVYELPIVEADIPDIPSSKWYKILTTKNVVKIDQGGTGATDAATARTKLGITPANIGAISTSGGTITGNLSATGLIATDFINTKSLALTGEFYINNGASPTISFNSSTVSAKIGSIYYATPADSSSNRLRFLQHSRSSSDYSKLAGYEVYQLPVTAADIPDAQSSKWYEILTTKNAVTVAQGGTGATTAAAARTNLGITPANIGAVPAAGGTISGNLSIGGNLSMTGTTSGVGYLNANHVTIEGNFYVNNGSSPKIRLNSTLTGSEIGSIAFSVAENSVNNRFHFIQHSRSSADYSRLTTYEVYYLPYTSGDLTSNQWYPILTAKNTVTVAQGGTGLTAAPSLQVDLASTSAANIFTASPRPGVTGTLAVSNGGTGATSKSGARTNLGISSGTSLPSSGAEGDIFFLYS